jgi:hypothetical protein
MPGFGQSSSISLPSLLQTPPNVSAHRSPSLFISIRAYYSQADTSPPYQAQSQSSCFTLFLSHSRFVPIHEHNETTIRGLKELSAWHTSAIKRRDDNCTAMASLFKVTFALLKRKVKPPASYRDYS